MGKNVEQKGNNDECPTPPEGVHPILEYIPSGAIVWCPFDTEDSHFVKMIGQNNPVIYSHTKYGQIKDFFEYEPAMWDILISNPPFTGYRKTIERVISFGKPFALMGKHDYLRDAWPLLSFINSDTELQLLLFEDRLDFQGQKKINFKAIYYCSQFLPRDIVIKKLNLKRR